MEQEQLKNLIRQVKNGNKDAYIQIVTLLESRIRRFVSARCSNKALVDEIVQDSFIWAYNHLDQFEEGSNFVAWLYAIARTKTMEELKKLLREAKNHKNYIEYILASADADVTEEDNFENNKTEILKLCVSKLGKEAENFLRLRYELNMSHAEIAEIFGRTESWAKVYFFRLKETLRKCLEENLKKQIAIQGDCQ